MPSSPTSAAMPASPRGAFSRPASPSKSHATPLRRRLASPVKKILGTEFINNWTPTRMTTQLQNAIAGARKQRAWERQPRKKSAPADVEGRPGAAQSRPIYKRFDPSEDTSTTLRQQAKPQARATKKIRLSDQESGAPAAWDSPRRSLPHKMPTVDQYEDNDAEKECHHSQPDETQTQDNEVLEGQNAEEDTDDCTGPLSDRNGLDGTENLEGSEGLSAVADSPGDDERQTPMFSEIEVTRLMTEAQPTTASFEPPTAQSATSEPDATDKSEFAPSASIDDEDESRESAQLEETTVDGDKPVAEVAAQMPTDDATSNASEDEDVSEAEEGHLRRILTPYNGSFKASDLDDADLTEDLMFDEEAIQPPLSAQQTETNAEIVESASDTVQDEHDTISTKAAESISQDATVTEALLARLFELQSEQAQDNNASTADTSQLETINSKAQESPNAKTDSDNLDVGPNTENTNEGSVAGEDMFDIDIQSLRAGRSPSPDPMAPTKTPGTDWVVEETTTTIRLNDDDDETVLRDFLSRSNASKAAKIARRSSLSNKRDSDVVRHALASPRKPLEEMDTNSPLMSPQREQDKAMMDKGPISPSPVEAQAIEQSSIDELVEDDNTSTCIRRSGRSRVGRSQRAITPTQRTITVRREEQFVLKRTEAQELSSLTRSNTRRNKGGSVSASATLKRLESLVSEVLPNRDEQQEGRRGVRWNDTDLVMFFDETSRGERLVDGVDSAQVDENEAASQAKPKAKRAKALGAVNGTPAKKKKATRSGTSEEVLIAPSEESAAERAKGDGKLPTPSDLHADKENTAQGQTNGPAKSRVTPQRRSMVPRPRSSARLRKEA